LRMTPSIPAPFCFHTQFNATDLPQRAARVVPDQIAVYEMLP